MVRRDRISLNVNELFLAQKTCTGNLQGMKLSLCQTTTIRELKPVLFPAK